VKARHPDYVIKIVSMDQVDVTPPGKSDTFAYMQNGYAEYVADPARLDDIIARRVRSLDDSIASEGKALDRDNLVVLIRERRFLNAAMEANVGHMTADDYTVQRAVTADIASVLAINTPDSFMYPPDRQIRKAFGAPSDILWRDALANTRRLCAPLAISALGDGVTLIECDNGLSASAILDPTVWSRPELAGRGDSVVALAKFGVLAAHTGDPASIGALERRIADLKGGPSLLSDTLLVRTRTGWTEFKAAR